MTGIDLNADLGETVDGAPTADDTAMFAVISSASIACGGHAGDAASMRAAVDRAQASGTAVGAHPSYPDRSNFGRAPMSVDPTDLQAAITSQLSALKSAGADIRYVKPHGGLYHAAGSDPAHAKALVRAVLALSDEVGRALPVLAMGPALVAAVAETDLSFVREAFLDRGYTPDGDLVPRGMPGALVSDPAAAAERAVRLAREGIVVAIDGSLIAVDAASLCVHGDSPAAATMARAVRAALDRAGITVRAPW